MSIATDTIVHTIADEVRSLMARRRVTGKHMAERLGLTEMAFSRRALGRVPFTAGEIVVIAQELDADVRDLLPHLDSNQKPFDLPAGDDESFSVAA